MILQRIKIDKALKIIYRYLPSTYPKVEIKIYKTCYSMLRAGATNTDSSYRQTCDWYCTYLKKHKGSKGL